MTVIYIADRCIERHKDVKTGLSNLFVVYEVRWAARASRAADL